MSEAEMMREWEEERELPEAGWTIEDVGQADWAVRKIAENIQERDRKIEWLKAEIEKAKVRCETDNAWLSMKLDEYSKTVPMHETKTQSSLTLPSGKLVRVKAKKELRMVDEDLVLDELEADGRTEFIKIKKSVDWAPLKKVLTEDGECMEGVRLEDVPERFTVRPNKEG